MASPSAPQFDKPGCRLYARDILPSETQFTVFGTAALRFPMAGGHVRVGLKDAVYLQRGVLAETNAAMVEKARNIVETLGGQAMSATEARASWAGSRRKYNP